MRKLFDLQIFYISIMNKHISQDPTFLDEIFCKREEFSIPTNISIGAIAEDPISEDSVRFHKDHTSLKDWKYILARTKKSYNAVKEDAQKQGVSTTQLLALHMYRENQNVNRDLAILSYKIYKKEDLKSQSLLILREHSIYLRD